MPAIQRSAGLTAPGWALGVLACAAAGFALAGCGGGSHSSTTAKHNVPSAIRTTAPAGAVVAARRWARAVSSGNCAAINRLSLLALTPARCKAILTTYPSPVVARVGAYVRGAVADLDLLGRGTRAAAIFVRVRGRGWRFVNEIATARAIVGTKPLTLVTGATMLKAVLPSIARGSCTNVAQDFLADTLKSKGAQGSDPPTAANCFKRVGTELQAMLRGGVSPVVPFGGNARVTFYRAGIGKGAVNQYVFVVVTQNHAPRLFSEYPLAVAPAGRGRTGRRAASNAKTGG